MAWTYLLLAGACEMIWPLGFKYTHGFSQRYWAVACTFAVMGVSLWLMGQATKQGIHVGTAYAVWTGIGAAGTAVLGIILFNEPRDLMRVGCLSLIILGVIGLKFLSPPEQPGGAAIPKGDVPAAVVTEARVLKNKHIETLTALCNLPTAPFREEAVIAWLLAWAGRRPGLRTRRDKAGNVYVAYRRGRLRGKPLVIEAHMDHPGFIVQRQRRDGTIEALFRGGVKPSHFKDARVRLWDEAAEAWRGTRVRSVKTIRGQRPLRVVLERPDDRGRVTPGTLGMWDLPDARVSKGIFSARVCDDLAGVAAMVCLFDALLAKKIDGHVIALFSRAEEVGFAGVLAVCENRWLPRGVPVIGLETSKASAGAPQGEGPVIRVGDRTGIFSAGLTHFMAQAAGRIADDDGTFKYQRKLMDGGTCNSTAFAAYGYDAAGICLALGNYHNMTVKGEIGFGAPGAAKAGPGIASETIHVDDFVGLVRLLEEVVRGMGAYRPGLGAVRERLAKMYREEQKTLLFARREKQI